MVNPLNGTFLGPEIISLLGKTEYDQALSYVNKLVL